MRLFDSPSEVDKALGLKLELRTENHLEVMSRARVLRLDNSVEYDVGLASLLSSQRSLFEEIERRLVEGSLAFNVVAVVLKMVVRVW